MMTIKGGIIKGNRKLNEEDLSFLLFLIVVKQWYNRNVLWLHVGT